MRRFLLSLAMSLLLAGGYLIASDFLAGDDPEPDAAMPATYVEQAPCTGCPLALTSAQVQARQGSTLFVIGGDWPQAATQLPSDVRLEANDVAVTLHPTAEGFEVTDAAGVGPGEVAIGLQQGSLLLNILDGALAEPLRFSFGLWDGSEYSARIPRDGSLRWTGTGAPRLVGGEAPAVEQPAEESAEEEPADETPQSFLDGLAAAFQGSDQEFLFDRLDPAVLDTYGPAQCRRQASTLSDPGRAYDVLEVSEPEPWEYAPDGTSTTVDEVIAVSVQAMIDGESQQEELHLGTATGQITWFTDCGDPVA